MGLGGLVLIAAGAILVWGVTDEPSGLDLDAIGVILMVIGIVGFVLSMPLWRSWWGPGFTRSTYVEGAAPTARRTTYIDEEPPPPPGGPPLAVGALKRCGWVPEQDPPYVTYHDEEGVPSVDDRHLFELLVLEGAQAGLSWSTILNKRGLPERVRRLRPAGRGAVRCEGRNASSATRVSSATRARSKRRSPTGRPSSPCRREAGSFDAYVELRRRLR